MLTAASCVRCRGYLYLLPSLFVFHPVAQLPNIRYARVQATGCTALHRCHKTVPRPIYLLRMTAELPPLRSHYNLVMDHWNPFLSCLELADHA